MQRRVGYRADLESRTSFPVVLFLFPERICIYLHFHIGIYTDMDVHVCIYVYMYVYAHVCICRYLCVCLCICRYVSRFLQFIFWKMPLPQASLSMTLHRFQSITVFFMRELTGKRHLSHSLGQPVHLS